MVVVFSHFEKKQDVEAASSAAQPLCAARPACSSRTDARLAAMRTSLFVQWRQRKQGTLLMIRHQVVIVIGRPCCGVVDCAARTQLDVGRAGSMHADAHILRLHLEESDVARKTYAQIQEEIAKLQREAEEVRSNELQDVIDKINKAIEVYGLRPNDLTFQGARAGRKSAKVRVPRTKRKTAARKTRNGAVAKYRDDQGNTWVGRGPRPQWLRDALAAGKSLNDFLA
jgi:DNA-binding protein H-NS